MVPVSSRLESLPLDRLIAQQAYFVLYAPRQTGKTTAMREWANQLNHAGKYIGVLVSMEAGAAFPHDVGRAEDAILGDWQQDIRLQLPRTLHPPVWHTEAPSGQRIRTFLTEWALDASRPLVVLLDEIDALTGYGLISVLRQLRPGFSACHLSCLAQRRWLSQSRPAAGGLSGLLAPARTATSAERPLSRNCAPPGDDGISAPRGQPPWPA